MEWPAVQPAIFICPTVAAQLFIARSKNKNAGTGDITEHRPSPFVVAAGNANT
jgi:hypothetical protein